MKLIDESDIRVILVDTTHTKNNPRFGGIGLFERKLVEAVYHHFDHVVEINLIEDRSRFLLENEKNSLKPKIFISGGPLWLYDYKDTLLLYYNLGIKLVFVIQDVIPLSFPELHGVGSKYFKKFLSFVARHAHKIIFTTRYNCTQFLRFFKDTDLDRCIVINGLGCDFETNLNSAQGMTASCALNFPRNYIMYVSTLIPRKNHQLLLDVYDSFVQRSEVDIAPHLIIVGRHGWGVEGVLEKLKQNNTYQKITYLPSCDDTALNELYLNAKFLVYPSLHEGWGLPITEALMRNKFVLCSDHPSMDAACQSLCLRLNPKDTDGWCKSILFFSNDTKALSKAQDLIAKKKRIRNWSEVFEEIFGKLFGFD